MEMNIKYHIDLIVKLSTILFVFCATVSGQNQIKVDVEDVEFEELTSPELGRNNDKNWDQKDWLEAEVAFEVTLVDPKNTLFVDELLVKWYLAAPAPKSEKSKGFVLIQKEVVHVNIPVKEKLFSSVYLSPSSLLRLTDDDNASKSAIDRIGGEILFKGKTVGEFSSRDKPGWWKSSSLSKYNKVELLSKDETPFYYFWWDRYAENKSER